MNTVVIILIGFFVGYATNFTINLFSKKSSLIKKARNLPKTIRVERVDEEFIFVKDKDRETKYFVSPDIFRGKPKVGGGSEGSFFRKKKGKFTSYFY